MKENVSGFLPKKVKKQSLEAQKPKNKARKLIFPFKLKK